MDPLGATASIIAVLQLSSKVVGYLTNVKDASRERAQCAIEVSNLHSLLLNLKFHLESEDINNPWYIAVRALAIKNGPLDQFEQALQTLQARMTDRGQSKKVTDILMWKFKKDEVDGILRRVERLKTLVEIALQRDHLKLSQAIRTDTQAIKDDVRFIKNDNQTIKDNTSDIKYDTEVIKYGINSVKIQGENAKIHRLLEWISASNYSAQQSDIMKRRQNGTGQWFLDAPQVKAWLSEPQTTLFCPGIPGAGKTVLAATAIHQLLNYVQSDSVGVAYIYCNYKAREEQDTSHMLSAILKQLVQAQPQSSICLETLHNQHQEKGTRPLIDDIFMALMDVVSYYSTIHIVVDALDECQDSDGTRRQFLARLDDLQVKCDIRLMFTSRFIPEIVDGFEKATKLEIQASKDDVEQYLAGQLYRLPRCIQKDDILQVVIQDAIVEATGGMFLLARLFVDSLLDKRTKAKVKSTLTALSQGYQSPSQAYDQAYGQAIERIEGQLPGDTALAKSVLTWVTNANRPLTIIEICHAVAIEPDQEGLDSDDIPDINDLVSVCAGLVSVDEKSKIVRLVHYTTQEYLERTQDLWNPGAQLRVASTCLTYLSFPVFRHSMVIEDFYQGWFDQNPFVQYAAVYWGVHILPFQAELREQACSLLRDRALAAHATRARIAVLCNCDVPMETTCLHLIAELGLDVILSDFIQGKGEIPTIPIHARDRYGRTPFLIAAQMGHEKVVKVFLENGRDLTDESLHELLYYAAGNGQESIVNILLDSGADIDGVSHAGTHACSALEIASMRGHECVVRNLLEKGADINTNNGRALRNAISNGHEDIAKLLVSQGINLNKVGPNDESTALQIASELGYDQTVRYLLERGADVHVSSARGTALNLAVYNGNDEVAKTLLSWGADVNAQSEFQGTSLMFAAKIGSECMIEILLSAGADVEGHSGEENHNALQMASTSNNPRAVQILLDHGADVNSRGGYLDSAIQAASFVCCTSIVELLIKRGADVNAQGGLYENALNAATIDANIRDNNRKGTMRLLLEKGADINHRPYLSSNVEWRKMSGKLCGSIPNQLAYWGNTEMLSLCFEKYNADRELTDLHGRTAIHVAAGRGYSDAFNYLLDLGLNPDTKDLKGDDILSYAASSGSDEILDRALKSVARPRSRSFWSPLHWACRSGKSSIVERLVEQGYRNEFVALNDSIGTWDAVSIAIHYGNSEMFDELSPSCRSLLNIEGVSRNKREVGKRMRNIDCDGCFCMVYAPYYHCQSCDDFDYCFMCKPFFEHLHPNHTWGHR